MVSKYIYSYYCFIWKQQAKDLLVFLSLIVCGILYHINRTLCLICLETVFGLLTFTYGYSLFFMLCRVNVAIFLYFHQTYI